MQLINDIQDMQEFCVKQHQGQTYGSYDYTYHLNRVHDVVMSMHFGNNPLLEGLDLNLLLMTALGHDLLEDTKITESELREYTHPSVVDAIVSVTKMGEGYSAYIRKCRANKMGLVVKIADTTSNLLESVRVNDARRIKKYTKQLYYLTK